MNKQKVQKVLNMSHKIFSSSFKLITISCFITLFVGLTLVGRLANANNFTVVSGQLAPNPNHTGDLIAVTGASFNDLDFTNAGTLGVLLNATLTNQNAISLTNEGASTSINQSGESDITSSLIDNGGRIINSGQLTQIVNRNGAYLLNHAGAELRNQTGASLQNFGTYSWGDQNGESHLLQSSISNLGTFTNRDAGTQVLNFNGALMRNEHDATLINQSGALIDNSEMSTVFSNIGTFINTDFGSTVINQSGAYLLNQTEATQINRNGAILKNIGIHIGFDPNGDSQITQSLFNNLGTLTNTDSGTTLRNDEGAQLFNQASGRLINQNEAQLVNFGVARWTDHNGDEQVTQSLIDNQGMLTNTGIGTTITIQSGANFWNRTGATLLNTNSAELVNEGAYLLAEQNGNRQITQSLINNQGIINNSGAGAVLNNQAGANLLNQTNAALMNQNGAVVNNIGSFNWADQEGVTQKTQSFIANQGEIINTDDGTQLNNRAGAILWNQNGGSLINTNQATLTNEQGATIINEGSLQNDATIINVGEFNVADTGSVDGVGQYIQTAGKTFVNGHWSQNLTQFQGGEISGTGVIKSKVTVDGGVLAPGDFASLTIDGDLIFDDGIFAIKVAGFGNAGIVNVSGKTIIQGGKIQVDFINGYIPSDGESFSWLKADGGIVGLDNLDYSFNGLPEGVSLRFNTDRFNPNWTISGVPVAPVPIPQASWLFLCGLLGLIKNFRPASFFSSQAPRIC
jgi:hypothetical protein